MNTSRFGFSLVEALISSAIFSLLIIMIVSALVYGRSSSALVGSRARASFLAEEGMEAARNIRDAGFANLQNGTYGVTIAGGQWNLAGSSDVTDGFTRRVAVASVNANTKRITVTVAWTQNLQRTGTISAVTYLANWR